MVNNFRKGSMNYRYNQLIQLGDIPNGFQAYGKMLINSIGTIVACNYSGYTYRSLDYGATWNLLSTAPRYSVSTYIAGSSDLTKLISCTFKSTDYLYTSINTGDTWTQQTNSGLSVWSTVASSSDGIKLVASDWWNDDIYTSADSGASWTNRGSVSCNNVGCNLICDSTGDKIVFAYDERIYHSINQGASFNYHIPLVNKTIIELASSSDANNLIVVYGTQSSIPKYSVYISNDNGASWSTIAALGEKNFRSCTMSPDGTKMAVWAEDEGKVYTSTDSGGSWYSDSVNGWLSSSDSQLLISSHYIAYRKNW